MKKFTIQIQDLEYPAGRARRKMARIYRPQAPDPVPAIVELSGGGWINGGRLNNDKMNQQLAESGVLVMAIDVSKPPEAGFPDSIQDLNAAVRWLRRNAYQLGGARLIGGLGASTGAHQQLLNALRPNDPLFAADHNQDDASFDFLIACWPVTDPVGRLSMAARLGMTSVIESHSAYFSNENDMALGSPLGILQDGKWEHLPPLLLHQSVQDDKVPARMTLEFAEAYSKSGGEVEIMLYSDEPHSFVRKKPDSLATCKLIERTIEFVHRVARA